MGEDDLIERARNRAATAPHSVDRRLLADLADALAAAREREARLQEERGRWRACAHRLVAKGEALTGWIEEPEAKRALAEWSAEARAARFRALAGDKG